MTTSPEPHSAPVCLAVIFMVAVATGEPLTATGESEASLEPWTPSSCTHEPTGANVCPA